MERNLNRIFVFDVDGTLTPSRGKIDPQFEKDFLEFCQSNDVYLITGSDRAKTIEQVGEQIYNACVAVHNCSGCDVWEQDKNVYTDDWKLSDTERQWLEHHLAASEFTLRTGNHIEERPGCVNYSIVGRNATLGERKLYVEYDQRTNERAKLAEQFNHEFPDCEAKVGGETGLDISLKGNDKSQFLERVPANVHVVFFGDRMEPGGNDRPLADAIGTTGSCHHVTDWRHTATILNNTYV